MPTITNAPSYAAQVQSVNAPAQAASTQATKALLHSVILEEKLSAKLAEARLSPSALDQTLATFWDEPQTDDCVHRTGKKLVEHIHQQDSAFLQERGAELMRDVKAMPPGEPREAALEKLDRFLKTEQNRIDEVYRSGMDRENTPPGRKQGRPADPIALGLGNAPRAVTTPAQLQELTQALRNSLP